MQSYLDINRQGWDQRTSIHIASDFYEMDRFKSGQTTLKEIELGILDQDLTGKKILHLQCHFGQDTISLARMGADATGVDLSPSAIKTARDLASELGVEVKFVESDVYRLPEVLDEQFDMVFTSYGVIGWLPDMDQWASVISHFLKPQGELVLVEFHPAIWMYDDAFEQVTYPYLNRNPISGTDQGSYTDGGSDSQIAYVCWNHGMSEVMQALISQGMQITSVCEYDFSPYNCLQGMVEVGKSRFRIEKFGDKFPLAFSLTAKK